MLTGGVRSLLLGGRCQIRKSFISIAILLLLGISYPAEAGSCGNMKVSSSGSRVAVGSFDNVYGPFKISCLGMVSFKFRDLSGNSPNSVIEHIIERRIKGVWVPVSKSSSRGVRSLNRNFFPRVAGQYRYRIRNAGSSIIRNWSMEGRIPLKRIPNVR